MLALLLAVLTQTPAAASGTGATAALMRATFAAPQTHEEGLTKVRAAGTARGLGADARGRALAQAERDALSLFLQTLLNTQDLAFLRPMFERYADYVRSSRVVEYERSDTETQVEAEVYLLEERIRADAAVLLLPRLREAPRVLIVLGEHTLRSVQPSFGVPGVAELALAETFRKRGFTVLDAVELRRQYSAATLAARVNAGPGGGAKLGRENRVQVAITGIARTALDPIQPRGSLHRIRAFLDLQVVRTSDGALLKRIITEAVVNGAAPEHAARQALIDATDKAVSAAMVEATLAMTLGEAAGIFWLTIEGPGSRRRLDAILRTLKDKIGVSEIEELRHSKTTARIRVVYPGPIKDLVEGITGTAYSDFSLSPHKVIGQEVSLRLTERTQ